MTYVQRAITLTFNFGKGNFGVEPGTNVVVEGLRVSADIVKAGGLSLGGANLRIYGLTLSLMNQLSTLGVPLAYMTKNNNVTIEVGDVGGTLTNVFNGAITAAWADFDAMPEVSFNVTSFIGMLASVSRDPPSSYNTSIDVATALGGMAKQAGLTLENNGVNITISGPPYFSGSIISQIQNLCMAANIYWLIDGGVLAIWPKGGFRNLPEPNISPQSGLVGYPKYTQNGIAFRTLFNPGIVYGVKIKMASSLTPANGEWVVYKLSYDLESQVPDGAWFCDVEAARPGYPILSQ